MEQRAIVNSTSNEQEDLAMPFEGVATLGLHSPPMVEGHITGRLVPGNHLPQRQPDAVANVGQEVEPL